MHDARLMIVEDEAIVARDIAKRLSRMGYEVVAVCHEPKSAIGAALTERPDLILMDVNLGGDMDGIDVSEEINRHVDIPVIYCTAYSNDEVVNRAKLSSPFGYILKPFENRELEITIEFALYKHAIQAEIHRTAARLDATLSSIFDGVIACRENGEILLFNRSAERLTGLEASATVGRKLGDTIGLELRQTGGSPRCREDWWVGTEEVHLGDQYDFVTASGRRIPVELDVSPIRGESESVDGSVVIAFRDITQRLRHENQIQQNAFFEPLTGLPNAKVFRDRLDMAFKLARRRDDHRMAVLFIDLDRFRTINEGLGHDIGDKVLMEVAKRIAGQLRDVDTLTRFSADMFVCLLEEIESANAVVQLTTRIQESICVPFRVHGHRIKVTATAGIALDQAHYADAQDLLRDADTANYRAKQQGREGRMLFDEQMHRSAVRFIEAENGLQQAITGGELEVHYQPIIDTESGRMVAMEALVRWNSANGLVFPGDFIPIAEDAGLIVDLGEWVFRDVCRQIAAWREQGLDAVPVAVNLSMRQFDDPYLLRRINRSLQDTGVEASMLTVEITESTAMRDVEKTLAIVTSLREAGLEISIDDFGTGYSSLAYLRRMPIQVLKIDRSFVEDVLGEYEAQIILKAIIAMANELHISTLAEGVESERQAELMRYLGCERMQGYLFGRPVPAVEIAALLPYAEGSREAAGPSL